MKKRNKILFTIPLLLLILLWTITTAQTSDEFKNSSLYKKIQQLEIPVWNILLWNTLTRYDFTRLLNAIECQDCIMPDATMVSKYDEERWGLFQQLPWKYFDDIEYLSWNHNWTNYYYCVANIWSDDIMNWYPRGTSVCWWKFCWQRNVSKAEFFQTLSNFLMDRNMFNYAAPRWEIKKWYNKLKTNEPWYKYLNTAQIALIKTKDETTDQITSRLEYTTYLAFCTFNPWACWFQTFPELWAGQWPIAETNVLIRAWIITTDDVYALNSAITPADALEKMWITYDRHIKCEFDSDYDCDWIPNHNDNCPYDYNPTQNDFDGDSMWDVCDDDIDWDWVYNPAWFVDDNGTINYWLLKKYPTTDQTPFGEQKEDTAFFIQVNSISQGSPATVQFGIAWPEEPASVEWDFWDLWKWNWKTATHTFNGQWVYTVAAKISTKQGKKHVLSTQIYLGQTTNTSYSLYIDSASINKDSATFQANSQWKYDYFERENKATWERIQTKWAFKFTTKLIPWVRNNIIIKGYVNDIMVASASADVYDNEWKFYTFIPNFAPQLKSIDTSITASLKLINIPLKSIENIAWNFWDETAFMDTKISNKHTYLVEWKKIVVERIDLENWERLFATSTLNIQNPNNIWNQTYNVIPSFWKKSVKLIFNNKWLSINDWDTLNAVINNQQEITLNKPKENASFLELADKQGVVKVTVKLKHWSLILENNGVITFWLKDETALNLKDIDKLFSWLKCDLDKDWVPDIYDSDVDWDGIPNLLGLVLKEREDCRLVVWENVDETIYNKHFWICSLDNCPFRANSDQMDLNVNWIWDICEWSWECWNNIIDLWENCRTCKEDVGPCTAFCWNGTQEPAENCKNCPQDIKVCPSLCGNGLIDSWEQCDHWDKNWKDWECTIACKNFDYQNPNCWNGIYDEWEDCVSCPVDLWDICIDEWLKTCWDKKIDPGETCINCPQDVGDCTAFCWNGIVEEAESCSNCVKDVWICTSSCWNGKVEPGEECDNWKKNWLDWKCSEYCSIVDPNHKCWDGTKDEYEQCDKWSKNWKISSRCTVMCTIYNPLKPNCGNWKIDPGETCKTCPVDLWEKCSATCWNGKIEIWEVCDNWDKNWYDWKCSFECKKTTSKCWNGTVELGEECDDWTDNWTKNSKNNCTKKCTISINNNNTICWNAIVEWNEECDLWTSKNWKGKNICSKDCKERETCPNHQLDEKEKCQNCSTDLKDICINNWEKPWECWNKVIEPWETCSNCEQDVWKCTGFCWNGEVEDAENCSSCPKDVGSCTSSCWNKKVEPGEECDNWASNWLDGKCSEDCKIVDSNHECWDGTKDDYEECDLWTSNWTLGSACTLMCTTYNPLKPKCWNWKIDPGENCKTCPVDLGNKCSVVCWNGEKEVWEECDDWLYNWYNWKCSFECEKTTAICWNGKPEWNEKCDDWDLNWTTESPNKCSEKCTKLISTSPVCWNGVPEWDEQCDLWKKKNWNKKYNCTKDCKEKELCPNSKIDKDETCETCPTDLGKICITEWKNPWECWNNIVEGNEDCKNCEKDVWKCTSFCWDWIVGDAEDCLNCPKDVKSCRWSCWNGKVEPGEECDSGKRNWFDGKCSDDCKIVDSTHECWDGTKDEYEECDKGEDNWNPSSLCTLMCTNYNSKKPKCGNWEIDPGETCTTCPVDLGSKCTVVCWNWIKQIWEECDNWENNGYDWKCSFDCKKTKTICWNGTKETWEDCDDWGANWTASSENNCSIKCTTNISPKPICWNGVKEWDEECDLWSKKNWKPKYICTKDCKEKELCPNNRIDVWEDCTKCPQDLKDKCVDDWTKTWCWNDIADGEENCTTCEKDVWKCSAYCWNNIIEEAEDCKNCPRDVWKCTGSCWNGIVEPGEDCDNGSNNNWYDWLCGLDCKSVNPNQKCWNEKTEWTEKCDDWEANWTIGSICTVMCVRKDQLRPNCWNGVIDPGETCNSCPFDLGTKCLHVCWDWKINTQREECDNWTGNWIDWVCWFDCKKTKAICWNGVIEGKEQCDEGTGNWVWDICTERCKLITPPKCWNGKKEFWEECDYWNRNWLKTSICWTDCKKVKTCPDGEIQKNETCQSCAADLGDRCIAKNVCWNWILEDGEECDDWRWNGVNKNCDKKCKKLDKCWNKKIDEWETCQTCERDVWKCTAKCWNWVIEEAETCLNCPEDVGECTASCWNGILEAGEQCDNGDKNGKDWICSKKCEYVVNKDKPYCWDWEKNTEREQCDNWEDNGASECSYICTNVYWPTTCGNGIIDLWETCAICPLDLWFKCQTKCGNKILESNREQCDNWTRNGRDWKCTTQCKTQPITVCWNWVPEEWEACDNGPENWKDKQCTKKCTLYNSRHPNCWNWIVDSDENCRNCPEDVGLCVWSCWNGVLEAAEECDHWSDNNGKDNLCDKDCRNIDPNKLCWNGYTNEDEWEECDDWEQNWINWQCSLNCKNVTRPNCGNWKIESDENCNNCPEDLGVKCLDYCGNDEVGEGEQCDYGDKNGKNKICTYKCKRVDSCWNDEIDEWETCRTCSKDLKDICIDKWETCPNWKVDWNEKCTNCPKDTWKCTGSCWNGVPEWNEQCDNWTGNWVDWSCSADCMIVDPEHYCWNWVVDTPKEKCDKWKDNWIFEKGCTVNCTEFDPEKPNCWNGKEDEWETCEDCDTDLWEKCKAKCWDWIITEPYEQCDPKADNWEGVQCSETCSITKPECLNWECDTVCNKSIDKDCDGCLDDEDPCPDLPWDPNWTYKCCPELPPGPPETLCPDGDCPLVNPICNQCPCQFADYSNTLQKDDQVRARLRDQWFMVHYNYSNLVNIANFIN